MDAVFPGLGYAGMFLSALLAATLLPLGSEPVFAALLLQDLSTVALVAVATVGNVLGSVVNYGLGRWLRQGRVSRWLHVSETALQRAERWFGKYGLYALLLAWMPIIGDPITVMAGVMRVRLLWFLILVTISKLSRYAALAYLVSTALTAAG